ncbi:MAG: hypothetical protein J1F23_05065 [Oscillospiraceae bacterium]|nr:hypothetical protein [Oscillospiraceae bacterium]
MTEKELRKLKRSDYLQLLLTQGKDMSAVQTRLDETTEEIGQLQAANEHLKAKLNEKDEQIEKLKERLDDKDATISALRREIEEMKTSRRIELEEFGSIAMASLSLNGVFEAAQEAADQYLYNIRVIHDELMAKRQAEKAKQENLKKAIQTAHPAPQPLQPEAYSMPQALQQEAYPMPQAPKPEAYPIPQAPKPEAYPIPQAPKPETYPMPQVSKPEAYPIPQAPKPETYPIPQAPKPEAYPTQRIGLFDRLFGRGTR